MKIQAGSAGKFLAVWSTFTTAVFAYLGTELVGVTVGECANPRKGANYLLSSGMMA